MSVDASRLSAALRAQAVALAAIADALDDREPAAAGTAEIATPSSAQPAPGADAPRRGRGRPAKGETPPPPASAVPAPSPAATEPDPFGAQPAVAAPTVSLEDVRAALVALKDATSQDIALNALKTAGGATNLPQLPADKYAAVVAACKAAMPAPAAPAADPFEVSSPSQTEAPSLEDVKAAVVEAQKRTSTDAVQKVVMDHGGKAPGPNGVPGPSLKAIPVSSYAAVIAAVKALPTTK